MFCLHTHHDDNVFIVRRQVRVRNADLDVRGGAVGAAQVDQAGLRTPARQGELLPGRK